MKKAVKVVKFVAWILAIIGAFNWGLVGAFNFDLVATICGSGTILSRIIYILVGLSAILLLIFKFVKPNPAKK